MEEQKMTITMALNQAQSLMIQVSSAIQVLEQTVREQAKEIEELKKEKENV